MENFIIDNDKILKEKVDMIEALTNIEIATNIIKETKNSSSILDDNYDKLRCEIKYIEENTDTHRMLKTFFDNTANDGFGSSGVTLQDCYELCRDGENERFLDTGNRMLLWHGSGISNFVGILGQGKINLFILGMRIAPPEAPKTGYNFVKGVYFADMSAKSLCYCRPSNGVGLILLCEVSLGIPKEYMTTCYEAENVPFGYHSTKGCGMTGPPESSYIDHKGVKVPIGKGEKTNYKVKFLSLK
jgi:poly [ADP-ribose] polymerase